jgi:ATP-dependent RNA helicase DDX49/DBP8
VINCQAANEKPGFLVIVFVAKCLTAEVLCEMLTLLEVNCVALHSRLSQRRRFGSRFPCRVFLNNHILRIASLSKFRSGRASVLIATDVASRGLDIQNVEMVINYDIPRSKCTILKREH